MKKMENKKVPSSPKTGTPSSSPLSGGEQKRSPIYSSPILGEVGRGNGLSRGIFGKSKKAFTLVELIIVITILAILATIAFISFQGYTSKSRDANRASTAKNIETGLSLFQTKAGVYPIQSTGATISLGATGVTVQGDLDLSIARVINLNEVPKDPKTGEPYNYISDKNGKGGKVLYYLENSPDYAFLAQGFADNETRIPIAKGQGPGVLLDTDLNMVTESVDLFGATGSVKSFTILVNDTTKVTGSGIEIGGGLQMLATKGGSFAPPSHCPTGFIPVSGNPEFMQPGFCVAEYEMALERDLVGTGELNNANSWNTWKGTANSQNGTLTTWLDGPIVSAPGKYPIANITQTQAIAACKSIGGHLITNNEWMTIARDIEANPVNWSGGVVGVNHISNGVSNSATLGCGGANTKAIYTDLPLARATKTGPGGNASCDTKRQLKLSNGEIIRDLAGNIREHVNGRNTKGGERFDSINPNACNGTESATGPWNDSTKNDYEWYSFSSTDGTAYSKDITQCTFENGYSYKKYGPKIQYMNANNGIGRIYSRINLATSDRVFLRGGIANNAAHTGVFTMRLYWTSSNRGLDVGFRCAF